MKKFIVLTALSFLVFACALENYEKPITTQANNIKASEEFVQGSEDLPLLVGMKKTSDESLGFDSESGSITSSGYESEIALEKVRDFYIATLPQMGWELVKNDSEKSTFKREKEKLEIEFGNRDGKNLITFFISSTI